MTFPNLFYFILNLFSVEETMETSFLYQKSTRKMLCEMTLRISPLVVLQVVPGHSKKRADTPTRPC